MAKIMGINEAGCVKYADNVVGFYLSFENSNSGAGGGECPLHKCFYNSWFLELIVNWLGRVLIFLSKYEH